MVDGRKMSLCHGLCYLVLVVKPDRPCRKPGRSCRLFSHATGCPYQRVTICRVSECNFEADLLLLLKYSIEIFRDMDRAQMESNLTGGGKLVCCFRAAWKTFLGLQEESSNVSGRQTTQATCHLPDVHETYNH